VLVEYSVYAIRTGRSVKRPLLSSLLPKSNTKSTCSTGPALFLITIVEIVVIWKQLQHFVDDSVSVNRFLYTEMGKMVPILVCIVWYIVMLYIRWDGKLPAEILFWSLIIP
jgi:hypothetical protein